MSWHYWRAPVLYGLVLGPLHVAAAAKNGLTPFHMIRANPALPHGISLARKDQTLPLFRDAEQHLAFTRIRKKWAVNRRIRHACDFMAGGRLLFPVIAKPCRGHVGIGVRKIDDALELEAFLSTIPVDYILQDYCAHPMEYGIFFCRHPSRREGFVLSLTRKFIPEVTGDGVSTVRELVSADGRFRCNRGALLAHAKNLDKVLEKGRVWQVIVQGSHTYGSIFRDENHRIDERIHRWVNAMCRDVDGFHFGRFDVKVPDEAALYTGRGVKILEVNGCGADPIHVYDDRHGLAYAVREFYRFYGHLYRIAAVNVRQRRLKTSPLEVVRLFRQDTAEKRAALEAVG